MTKGIVQRVIDEIENFPITSGYNGRVYLGPTRIDNSEIRVWNLGEDSWVPFTESQPDGVIWLGGYGLPNDSELAERKRTGI